MQQSQIGNQKSMDIAYYFKHPKELSKETLYDLRSLLALYPYYQPARVLLLKNLFLLHDPTFDEELRRAAVYITDRSILFALVEETHYSLTPTPQDRKQTSADVPEAVRESTTDRTASLIDNFLGQVVAQNAASELPKRQPTPLDATVDYVAYLLETELQQQEATPELRGQNLIDEFINKEGGRIILQEEPEYEPETDEQGNVEIGENEYFTETLARIYIKQRRYSKALEIIKRLNLEYPEKNCYFADQIRFLEKLIINNNKQ